MAHVEKRVGRNAIAATLLVLVLALADLIGHMAHAATAPSQKTATRSAAAVSVSKVLAIIEENHSLAQMSAGMPYLYGLARRYGYATNYTAIRHPSEPNYLAIAGGSTFGDTADHNPAFQVAGRSVFGQAVPAGKAARLYAESMTTACQQNSAGSYAVKHNPWASFADERNICKARDLPLGTPSTGALISDVNRGTLPNVGMIVPNICNDAHDCSLRTADNWLRVWLPRILAGSDFTSGRLAVVVTADEDDRNSGNKVLTVVMHRSLDGHHLVVSSSLSHYSLTRLYDWAIGSALLGNARTAPDMRAAFRLP